MIGELSSECITWKHLKEASKCNQEMRGASLKNDVHTFEEGAGVS